jgi:hypothetical protein
VFWPPVIGAGVGCRGALSGAPSVRASVRGVGKTLLDPGKEGAGVKEAGEVPLKAGALVVGDLRISGVPVTRPFRVPCMTPPVYGSVLHRPYRRVRQCCWYHSVDWKEATTMAADALKRALSHLATRKEPRPALEVVLQRNLPRNCPGHLQEAVIGLAWRHPIVASAEGVTDGVHRLTAMRQQGVKSTPALIPARAGQRLAEIPGAYPYPHLSQGMHLA